MGKKTNLVDIKLTKIFSALYIVSAGWRYFTKIFLKSIKSQRD